MGAAPVTVLRGTEANAAIHNADFISQWVTLVQGCPYATAFQRPEFVRPWYSIYRREWEPIVVVARNELEQITGLWLLAWNEERRALVHAGAHQAEYHTWLARPGSEEPFLEGAWMALKRTFSFKHLSFEYLPHAYLAELLKTTFGRARVWKGRRPLWRLDPEAIRSSFAKKSNKSRFNRLGRLGSLEFRRISDRGELERVIDDLIDFYDFRQGAVHSVMPFRRDALKRDFHLALATTAPESIILTVTYLAKRPIAAYWGLASGGQTHLGMLIHSPFVASHSPGKLHLMQLSEYLSRNGVTLIDLTPGKDSWKERFANDHDDVASAVLHASVWYWWRDKIRAHVSRAIGWLLRMVGATPKGAQAALVRIRRSTFRGLVHSGRKWISESREFRVYRAEHALAMKYVRDPRVQRNELADLMLLESTEPGQKQYAFLSTALARLEQGESVSTIRLHDRLAHYGWTTAQREVFMTEVDQALCLPPCSLLLYDFYSAANGEERELRGAALAHMVRAAFDDENVRYVYICVSAADDPSRHIIEAMGIGYQGSFHWKRRFGRVKKWADVGLTGPSSLSDWGSAVTGDSGLERGNSC